MRWTLTALGLLALAAPAAAKDHPLNKDKTGIGWVIPFTKARAKAKTESRLLMIKPVAFGTSPDGGW